MNQLKQIKCVQSIARKVQLTGLLFLLLGYGNHLMAVEKDSISAKEAQHLLGLSLSGAASSIPGASFSLFKEKISYSYFAHENILFKGGFTFYQTSSDFNAFDKTFMFNVDFEASLVWRKLHLDLGLHNGNYAEFIQNLDFRPAFIQYASIGGGFTLPIFKKTTIDFSIRNSIVLNTFSQYNGTNPFEAFLGLNYIVEGNNDRYRRINKHPIKLTEILKPHCHFVDIGFSGGAFNWPSDEGIPFTYINLSSNYRYVVKKRLSLSTGFLFTVLFSESATINGYPKKYFNTLNGNIGIRYHLGAFFGGALFSVGNFAAFQDPTYLDHKIRPYFNPEIGFNARITKSILFEFQMVYAISINHLIDQNEPSSHYPLGTVGVVKKIGCR